MKKCVFNMLGFGWFRMKEQNSAFSEFLYNFDFFFEPVGDGEGKEE